MIVPRTTALTLLTALLVLATVGLLAGSSSAPGFGDPLAGLSSSEIARFEAGLAQFVGPEHALPDGLGPVFNAPLVNGAGVTSVACSTCHTTPAIGGGDSTQLETRFGRVTNGVLTRWSSWGLAVAKPGDWHRCLGIQVPG